MGAFPAVKDFIDNKVVYPRVQGVSGRTVASGSALRRSGLVACDEPVRCAGTGIPQSENIVYSRHASYHCELQARHACEVARVLPSGKGRI